jgi:hypothetical protein
MRSTTTLVSPFNSVDIADRINAITLTGAIVTINGDTPIRAWGTPCARAWNNGTVSFRVAAKRKGKFRDVFVKAGFPITITTA